MPNCDEPNLPAAQPTDPNLELLKQQDEHQYQIARRQIDVTLQNFQEQREHHKYVLVKNNRAILIFSLVVMIFFFGFGAYALWLGKESLLSDILKVILGAFGGGGIGYAIGNNKKKSPET